jgi:hypothetical protein
MSVPILVLELYPLGHHLANDLARLRVNFPAGVFKPQILVFRNLTSDIMSETSYL